MCLFTNGSSEFKELFSSVVKIFFLSFMVLPIPLTKFKHF